MSAARTTQPGPGSTAAASTTRMPIFSPATALAHLWESAGPSMDTRTLQWFADGAGSHVATETMHLSGWLHSLACLVSQDHNNVGSFQSAESSGELLFSLANQVSTLNGLAEIAANASCELRYKLGEGEE